MARIFTVFSLFLCASVLFAQEASFNFHYKEGYLHFYLQNEVECPLYVRLFPKDGLGAEMVYRTHFTLPARGGIVVKVREHFGEGGVEEKYRGKDNHVIIYHEDGSLGAYAHLDYQGVLVKLGDRVEAGQPIGISGFTGYTSVPHLHFVVRCPTESGQVTIPIRFRKVCKLKEGKLFRRIN